MAAIQTVVKPEIGVVLPDMHVPKHDIAAVRAATRYIKARQPDKVIQLGDYLDMNVVSSHNEGNLRAVEGQRIIDDYDTGNIVLDDLQNAAPNASWYLLEGNHEYRLERYLNAHPATSGLVEVPLGLRLSERGIRWIPNWSEGEVLAWGKANFIHGLYTNEHHAKKHVEIFGESVFYGHTHDVQRFSKVTKATKKTRVGQSLGCLCDSKAQPYMRGRPTKWEEAIATFYMFPDGMFRYEVHSIFDGILVVGGEIYDGNKD